MRLLKFTSSPKPRTAILIKATDVEEMKKMTYLTQYLQRLVKYGYPEPGNEIVVIGLEYPKSGNIKKDMIVSQSKEVLEYCDTQGIENLLVVDSKYYPYLSGNKKTEEYVGTVQPCAIDGYGHINVLAGIHHVILSFNPDKLKVFENALLTLAKHRNGTLEVQKEVQYSAVYPRTYEEIDRHLTRMELQPKLAVDIETRGTDKGDALRFDRGFLSTIAISDTINSGISFATDSFWFNNPELESRIKLRLKTFFTRVLDNPSQRVYLHNGLFDAKFLIYNLFMDSNTDYTGMYEGIRLFSNIHDTMIMVYLCTNSTIKTDKGLKDVARDYIGDYKIDVKDITQHQLDTVLEYNLKDTCATMWVAEKYELLMMDEEQLDVYLEIFRPSFGFLLEMMMTGLPMSKDRIQSVKAEFEELLVETSEKIKDSHHVKRTVSVLKYNAMTKYNSTHKKQKTEEDFSDIEFNPGSTLQMRILLFDILGLKVLGKTDTGQPAVGAGILKQYQAEAIYNGDDDVAELITAILDFAKASKMLGTFISAFEELGSELDNGEYYLRGNLKLGGTQCVTADTLFTTNRGVIPYHKLKLNDLVVTHTGEQKPIIDLFSNGVKQIYKVTTTRGHILKTSAEHPYYVDLNWVTADKLNVGDNLKVMYPEVEDWRVVSEFPRYMVSSYGRVINVETGKYLTSHKKNGGKTNRLKVTLARLDGRRKSGNKKDFHVSSLVAEYFLGTRPNGYEVRHLNGVAWDNHVKNLAYGTSADNTNDAKGHGTMSKRTLSTTKLSQDLVDYIRRDLTLNNAEMGRKLGVARELIRDVRNLKRWLPQNEFQGYKVDFFDDTVLSIEILEPEETFGATIADDHSHVTNGIVTHNSGRLSSSEPNLQNLPAGGSTGKQIKSCFVAPDGWLFAGADFSALEDKIGAILSKDKMKTLEFSKGMDGHSLRALAFFPEELPEIDITDVEAVNKIKDDYPDIRQKAKAPSFALQYQGTWVTIKETLGCSEAKAKQIEASYHQLYSGLAEFSKNNAKFAGQNGYVKCAFGLKLRTPLSKAKYDGVFVDDIKAEAEARSSSNATTQSYGMLMNRAIIAFRNTVINSVYRDKIRFINTIHDAVYLLIKNEPDVIKFVNDELIKEMEWQDDPILHSNEVKLGAELDIGKSWDKQYTLKNGLSLDAISTFIDEHDLAGK